MRNSRLPITTSGWVKSMTTSVLPSVSRLIGSPASPSADRVRSSAACTAPTMVDPTLPLAPNTATRMVFTLDRTVGLALSTVGHLSTEAACSVAGMGHIRIRFEYVFDPRSGRCDDQTRGTRCGRDSHTSDGTGGLCG